MDSRWFLRGVFLASVLCWANLSSTDVVLAATFPEFVDPHPVPGNQFGATVVALSTGNVVITSPSDDAGGPEAGAVYLFDGSTGALISTLLGSSTNDNIGNGGVTALANGNYVVASWTWDNGGTVDAGAATWCSGTTGLSGVVSPANSLVGTSANDQVGYGVWPLTNGNYVITSPLWNNGAAAEAGAATLGSGTTGVSGAVAAVNSLVGSTAFDHVGGFGVTALLNGNYVVRSPVWDNGAAVNAGAATWGDGTTGATGAVSASNSLVGSSSSDGVGNGVWALSNGNYVVTAPLWDNGAIGDAGAATWCDGATGRVGVISAANSLLGSTAGDAVGALGVAALSNGNYVVPSPLWDNGAVVDAGAATWSSGITGATGVISAANSLIGSTANDQVGYAGVTALSNGNYVVASPFWDNGAVVDAGAVTWSSGITGATGAISVANSLIGSTANDQVGDPGATALSNGNYVVASNAWDDGVTVNAGAATWGSGTSGVTGSISVANSLIGSTPDDFVDARVTALSNGNYVVVSPFWDNGTVPNAGAATWGNGATGVSGVISSAKSLVGPGNYDAVGYGGVEPLSNGNYVVVSPYWDYGSSAEAGAATWGDGAAGVSGFVSETNSLIGSSPNDLVGLDGITALSNGNYVVVSRSWDNAAIIDAGAVTWGSGTAGVTGVVDVTNSLVGTNANAILYPTVVDDVVNGTFIVAFLEGSGRVRVGPVVPPPVIVSAVDIPNDQGGWLRLTFNRSGLDAANTSAPVAIYGAWRHVPGTIPAGPSKTISNVNPSSRLDERGTDCLRAAIRSGLDVRESDGRFYVAGPGIESPGTASAFPPGTWELVANVPAVQQAQYAVAVATISNAAANDFVVTAHTTTPSVWFVSDPVSGQSIDNLAPAAPTGLTASYSGGQTNLQWVANAENDLGSYRVYRGTSATFIPSALNQIAEGIANSYVDVGPAGGYYKVSAVDVNGNESGFVLVTPDQTTEVGEGPVAFALDGVLPNPTSGRGVHVAFALPTGAAARIELLDVSGRRILATEVGSLGAGRHTVNLAQGRRVAPGLYWVRLVQGANRRTTRVAIVE